MIITCNYVNVFFVEWNKSQKGHKTALLYSTIRKLLQDVISQCDCDFNIFILLFAL